ncbi:hypothetical protein [Deinococcus hohokamensis]|uniref:DUF11 domain-containing protein n=1 Tax=Deinococcus hohokamensis TaxID=309883 RepID=A0ABV9I7Q3_9DEIO
MKKSVTLSALLTLALSTGSAFAVNAPVTQTIGAPAGSTISNTASMDYVDDAATPATASSSEVKTTVERVPGISVTPDGTEAAPGQIRYGDGETNTPVLLEYLALNTGNQKDNFEIVLNPGTNFDASRAKVYVDANDNDVLDASERVAVTVTGDIEMEQDRKFWVEYSIPKGTAGGTLISINPAVTSLYDIIAEDSNNVGRIFTRHVHTIAMTAAPSKTITSPGTAVFANLFKNDGNTPVNASDLTFTTVNPGTGWTVQYSVNGGALYATPTLALQNTNGGVYAPGTEVELTTTVKAPGGLPRDATNTVKTSAYFTASGNSNLPLTDVYGDTQAAQASVANLSTVVKGRATVTKTGVNVSNGNAPIDGTTKVKPGDLLRYTITATNDGNSALFSVKVSDAIPTHTSFQALNVVNTQAGTLKYSLSGIDGSWSNTLSLAPGSQGKTLFVGVDTNGDGNVNGADSFAPNSTLTLTLDVKVNQFTAPAPQVP